MTEVKKLNNVVDYEAHLISGTESSDMTNDNNGNGNNNNNGNNSDGNSSNNKNSRETDYEPDCCWFANNSTKINLLRGYLTFGAIVLFYAGWIIIATVSTGPTNLYPTETRSVNDTYTYYLYPICNDEAATKFINRWLELGIFEALRNLPGDALLRSCSFTFVAAVKYVDAFTQWYCVIGIILGIVFSFYFFNYICCCCDGRADPNETDYKGNSFTLKENDGRKSGRSKIPRRDCSWLYCSTWSQQSILLPMSLLLIGACIIFFGGYLKSSHFTRCSPVGVDTDSLVNFAKAVEGIRYDLKKKDEYEIAKDIYYNRRCSNFKLVEADSDFTLSSAYMSIELQSSSRVRTAINNAEHKLWILMYVFFGLLGAQVILFLVLFLSAHYRACRRMKRVVSDRDDRNATENYVTVNSA